jgi:hypothetical protein
MDELFDRLIAAGGDGTDFLAALFRSTAAPVNPFRRLFLRFAERTIGLSADVLYAAAARFIAARVESVTAFYAAAVAEDARRDLFLAPQTLRLFWDYAFIRPPHALAFLIAAAEFGGETEGEGEFWDSPAVFPCMFDAVAMARERAAHFLDFAVEIAKRAPEWLVRRLGREVADFPCEAVFLRICEERFGVQN